MHMGPRKGTIILQRVHAYTHIASSLRIHDVYVLAIDVGCRPGSRGDSGAGNGAASAVL